ncbi:MAG TPA: hypothetical protein VIG64_10895 [Actinomycetota bacterium]
MDRSLGERALRTLPGLVLVALAVTLGIAFGYLRALVGLVIAAAIMWLGVSYFRAAGEVPPDPEAADVSSSELKYVCSVCGLELKVEVATTDRAPTHCRESMELVRAEPGTPPLRPV